MCTARLLQLTTHTHTHTPFDTQSCLNKGHGNTTDNKADQDTQQPAWAHVTQRLIFWHCWCQVNTPWNWILFMFREKCVNGRISGLAYPAFPRIKGQRCVLQRDCEMTPWVSCPHLTPRGLSGALTLCHVVVNWSIEFTGWGGGKLGLRTKIISRMEEAGVFCRIQHEY